MPRLFPLKKSTVFCFLAAAAVGLLLGRLDLSLAREGIALATAGEIRMVSKLVQRQGMNHGFPDLFRDSLSNLWCAFVSARQRDPLRPYSFANYEEGDFIVVRRKTDGEWSDELVVSDYFGVNFQPVIAESANGDIVVVWTGRRRGRFALYSRRIGRDLSLGSETEILTAGQLEGEPAVVADTDGRILLAAESYRRNSMDIVSYVLEGSGWRQLPDVSSSAAPEFRPRLAKGPAGEIYCAWDAYEDGRYRVKLSRYDGGAQKWSQAEEVPGRPLLDAYAPDPAVDGAGRVWIVHARNELENPDYGLRGSQPGGSPKPTVRLIAREPGGRWAYPLGPDGGKEGLVATGDLPRIEIGPDGALWLGWQFLPGHVNWKIGMTVYKGGRWSALRTFGNDEPIPIDGPPRRADQLPSIAPLGADTALVAYQRGRGAFRNRDIYERTVRLSGMPAGKREPRLTPVPQEHARRKTRPPQTAPQRDPVFDGDGGRYRLYFGDLHNHLLVDDGHQGSVDQLFNIHRDRYGSDFAATTSHGDSNKLLYSELARNDALTQALLEPGRFVTIPGFEWTQGDYVVPRAGHRHAIYETPGGPLYRPTEGFSDSIREFSDLMAKTNGMIFAHHITRAYTAGTDWSYVNVKVEPAAEMASSWGRFEYYQNPGHIRGDEMKGCSMQDVWRMGWRLGVIGGSDGHNLYADPIQGLTGVYAEELTRAGIFEAIRKRRCYATTGAPIELVFQVNGHLMGSEIEAAEGPLIEGWVQGARKLLAVEVVKYAKGAGYPFPVVYRAPLEGASAKVWWRDPDFNGDSMYYLRVTQEVAPALAARYAAAEENRFPTEMAWSSPVWVDRK